MFNPKDHNPTRTLIAELDLPPVYADRRLRVAISTYLKSPSRALPSTVKACGHYANSILAMHEAVSRGFDEAILRNERGEIAEATGENVFIVKDGVLRTNDSSADVLNGITRDAVLQIAAADGIATRVAPIELAALFAADEVFLTGTASEILPVAQIETHRYRTRIRLRNGCAVASPP